MTAPYSELHVMPINTCVFASGANGVGALFHAAYVMPPKRVHAYSDYGYISHI